MDKIALSGCVILKDDSILLLHRIKRDQYELPSGKIDDYESADMISMPEIKEEFCCDLEIVQMLDQKDCKQNGHPNFFLTEIREGQPEIGEPHTFNDLRYVQINELSDYRLSPNMKNLHEAILDKKIVL